MDEHQLEELMQQIKPAAAPAQMKQAIMDQVLKMPVRAEKQRFSLGAEGTLLALSLLALVFFSGWALKFELAGQQGLMALESLRNLADKLTLFFSQFSLSGIAALSAIAMLLLIENFAFRKIETQHKLF